MKSNKLVRNSKLRPSGNSGESAESGTQAEDRGANEFQTMRLTDIQPGTSAASNQRAASLKPPRVAVGRSHAADVNLPAAKSTRASMRMSLTRVPRAPGGPGSGVRCQLVLS